MSEPLRIGTLGAARITPNALIHPARAIGGVTVTAVAARDPARAASFAATHLIETVHRDYASLIADRDIDLVYNPLPIDQHASWTIAALEAGKHVLCEKPFAMNAGEARAMLATAERTGKRLVEAFHYRYHPAFDTCLTWVRSGLIGNITAIDAAFHVPIRDNGTEIRHRPETGGGAMMDLGCYPVNWALMLAGEVPSGVTAEAATTSAGVDEHMTGTLTFPSGATARVSADMGAGCRRRVGLTIEGSEGRIEFVNPLAPHMGASLTLHRPGEADEAAVISPITSYTWQLAAMAEALRDGTPLPTEDPALLLTQQDTLDRLYAAAGLDHLRAMGTGPTLPAST